MKYFFEPAGIALIGASGTPSKGGHSILYNVKKGFRGHIYPVNPRYSELLGIPCYPSIFDVPDPVDLAIIFIPASLVPQMVRDCASRGIPGVIVESGGFAETGESGKALQDELKQIRMETGIRIWGPNCMGVVDAVRKYIFSFLTPSVWDYGPLPGNVSMIVQSGMLAGGFLIDAMSHGVMGISKALSIGNKVDVEECELLEYLIDDPDTKAIALYLESIPNGSRFMNICKMSPKPIVVLKGGKSQDGARAAMSHTASMAGNGAIISSALTQSGAIEAHDFKQMMDISRALATFPDIHSGATGRTAILTFSGGAGIVSADFLNEQGLTVAHLSETTQQKLRTVFPEWMPVSNPIDLWPAVEQHGGQKTYQTAMTAVSQDPNIDVILLHLYSGGFALNFDMEPMMEEVRKAGKPVFAWLLGDRDNAGKTQTMLQDMGIPVYRELYRAVECIQAVFERSRWVKHVGNQKNEWHRLQLTHPVVNVVKNAKGVLDEHLSKQFLQSAGIPVVAEAVVNSLEDAVKIAGELTFPVVMKGLIQGMVHKSEHQLVHLHLNSEADVTTAFDALSSVIGNQDKILLQKQLGGRAELIVGMTRDVQFGPCVMCGMGGVLAEAIQDKVFLVAPFGIKEALYMIDRLKSRCILNGFRGEAPLDRHLLADILVRVGQIAGSYPGIQEMDINPLIIENGRPVAVDASILLD
jgi:acetyltransferase